MQRLNLALLMLLVALSTALGNGCETSGRLLLVTERGDRLVDSAVSVFIDDGVRCVTWPCPTTAREWRGRTDAAGRLVLPSIDPAETATVYVDGYLPAQVERLHGKLTLVERVEPVQPQRLALRSRFVEAGEKLEIRVRNPGPEPLTVVRPWADALERYGDWGGWHVLVKDARSPFLPEPFPGPFVPPAPRDLVTLEEGETLTSTIRIGNWERIGEAAAELRGQPLEDVTGRLTARVRWSEIPAHLRAEHPAPRVVASARTRRLAER